MEKTNGIPHFSIFFWEFAKFQIESIWVHQPQVVTKKPDEIPGDGRPRKTPLVLEILDIPHGGVLQTIGFNAKMI